MKQLKILSMTLGILFTQFGLGAASAANNHQANEQLITAVRTGNVAEVQRLIATGTDINCKADYDETPLIMASTSGCIDVVGVLLKAGADVNQAEENGISPLMEASFEGHTKIVRMLLEKGADVNQESYFEVNSLSAVKNDEIRKILTSWPLREAQAREAGRVFLLCCQSTEAHHSLAAWGVLGSPGNNHIRRLILSFTGPRTTDLLSRR